MTPRTLRGLPAFQDALALSRQPGHRCGRLYQGWIDTLVALSGCKEPQEPYTMLASAPEGPRPGEPQRPRYKRAEGRVGRCASSPPQETQKPRARSNW